MADLKDEVKEVLEAKDDAEAARIFAEEDVSSLSQSDVDKLAEVAMDGQAVSNFYLGAIKHVSNGIKAKLAKDLAENETLDELVPILEDDASDGEREALVGAFLDNGDDVGELYPAVIKFVSANGQARLNKALGESTDVDMEVLVDILKDQDHAKHRGAILSAFAASREAEDIASLIKAAGAAFNDQQALKLFRAIQDKD